MSREPVIACRPTVYWMQSRRTDGRCPAPPPPGHAPVPGGRAPLTRCCVGRGGGVMRCAGWPGASARGAPAPAAPDRRRVGRRPGFGGARLVRGVGTRRVRSRRPLSISRLPTASAQTTGSRRNISRSGRVGPANNSARHPRRGPARACVRPRRPAPSPRGPRSRAGSYLWPVREPRRTGGRCPATAAPGHAPVPGGRAPLRGGASYEAEG